MITACYYTIRHVISVLERGDYKESTPYCKKILSRYKNDYELQSLCPLVQRYIDNRRGEDLKDLIKRLKELAEIRKVCVSGGGSDGLLWLKERRP